MALINFRMETMGVHVFNDLILSHEVLNILIPKVPMEINLLHQKSSISTYFQ